MCGLCVVLQVLLLYKGKGFCGGAIYKPTWIITASHCMENTDIRFLKVVAGTALRFDRRNLLRFVHVARVER